jgi:hypothetical protein
MLYSCDTLHLLTQQIVQYANYNAQNHPLAFLKGRIIGMGDPRIVALILCVVVGVLYYLLR